MRFLGFTFQSQLLRRQILSLSMYSLQSHLELPVIDLIESLAPEPTRQGKPWNVSILSAEILRIKLPDVFSVWLIMVLYHTMRARSLRTDDELRLFTHTRHQLSGWLCQWVGGSDNLPDFYILIPASYIEPGGGGGGNKRRLRRKTL